MKLPEISNTLETSGVQETLDITLKVTSKAFKILTTTNYSRPIEAVIRELSCNATDSHVDAGNNDPIDVHIPTILEPWFSVRDNGVGMSEQDIINIYSVMFESNKTESNDFTGALGIGSKSPLAYTDQFEVISRYNGTTYTYIVFIDDVGMPKMAKLFEGSTTDRNGVEVKVTVKEKDFYRFYDKAKTLYKYFDIIPNLINKPNDISSYKNESKIQGNNWIMSNKEFHNSIFVIQGNVLYPVNIKALNLESELDFFDSLGIVIRFDIGDLNFASSREELHYDEHTIMNIKNKLFEISDYILNRCNNMLENCTSTWDAFIKINSFVKTTFPKFSQHIITKIASSSSIKLNSYLKAYIKSKGYILIPEDFHKILYDMGYKIEAYTYRSKNYDRITTKMRKIEVPEYEILVRDVIKFFLNDIGKTGIVSRMTNNISFHDAYLITAIVDTPPVSIDNVLSMLGSPELIKLSDQPKPLVKGRTTHVNVYVLYTNSISRTSISTDKIPDEGYFYLMKEAQIMFLNKHSPTVEYTDKDMSIYYKRYNSPSTLRKIGILCSEYNNRDFDVNDRKSLIGVTKTMYKKLSNRKGWYPLFDDFNRIIKDNKVDIENLNKINTDFGISSTSISSTSKLLVENIDFANGVKNLPSNSFFKAQVRPVFSAFNKIKNIDTIRKAVILYNIFKPSSMQKKKGMLDMKILAEQYPFIGMMSKDFSDSDFQTIIDPFFKQINQIDILRRKQS